MANAEKPASKSSLGAKFPPSRIAVIVFALVAAVIVIYELRVRGQYNASYAAVAEAFAASDEKMQRKDIDPLLSGSPQRSKDESSSSERFAWGGIMQTYKMRVYFVGEDYLEKVEPE